MGNKYNVIDNILKDQSSQGQGQYTYNIIFKELDDSGEDLNTIAEYVTDNLSYLDINDAPGLPTEAYVITEHAVDEQHETAWSTTAVGVFHKIAFTGDYSDLSNAPSMPEIDGVNITAEDLEAFDPIAFTGRVEIGDNIIVSKVLDLRSFSNNDDVIVNENEDEEDDNTKLHNLGSKSTYVLNYNDNMKAGTETLYHAIDQIATAFIQKKYPTFICSNAGVFLVSDVKKYNYMRSSSLETQQCQFKLTPVLNINDYTNERQSLNNITDEQAEEVLNDLELGIDYVYLIFDQENKVIYCKLKEEFSGNYNNLNNKPNIVQEVQVAVENNSIGLADVAISGDYEDLRNVIKYPNDIKEIEQITYTFHTQAIANELALNEINNPSENDIYYVTDNDTTFIYKNNDWDYYNERLCFKGVVENVSNLNEETLQNGDIYYDQYESRYVKYKDEIFNVFNLTWTDVKITLPEYFGKYAFSESLDYSDIINVNQKEINFNNFNLNIGATSAYFNNFNSFTFTYDNNTVNLTDEIETIANNYNFLQKIKIITTNNNYYFVKNISSHYDNNDNLQYIKIEYESELKDNFNPMAIGDQLNSLTISQIKGYMIFDYRNNAIYCKVAGE